MAKHLSTFENKVKESVNQLSAEYDAQAWNRLETQLPNSPSSNLANLVAAAAFVAVMLGGAAIWYYTSDASASAGAISGNSRKEMDTNYFQVVEAKKELVALHDAQSDSADERIDANNSKRDADQGTQLLAEKSTPSNTSEVDVIEDQQEETTVVAVDPIEEKLLSRKEDGLAFKPSVRSACEGSAVEFNLFTEGNDGNYLWNFGDGNFSNEVNPVHTYMKQGVYDITLSVTGKEDGQIRTKTIENLIVINPTPEASFDWEFLENPNEKPTIKVLNQSEFADQCEWLVDDSVASEEINPSIAFKNKGEHSVRLTVSNRFGCTDTKYSYVNVDKDYKLLAREQISPNGDGKYDSFMPEALKDGSRSFKLSVYDGQEVIYETRDATQPWDGTVPGNLTAQIGDKFPWIVILYNKKGEEEYYSGTITIIP
jgi:PKD repeat protein